MKKLLIVFVLLPLFSSAQDVSLIEDFKVWNMEEYPYVDNGQGGYNNFPYTDHGYSYELIGDTLINNVKYNLVYYRYNWYYTFYLIDKEGDGANFDNPAVLIGAIREDLINDKIYFIAWESQRCFNDEIPLDEEILLYDFAIEEGDTMHYSFPVELQYVLESKSDYMLGNGDSSTLYQFKGGTAWVKALGGIQDNYGLLGPIQYAPFEGGCKLNCVHIDSTYYLGNTNSNCDKNASVIVSKEDIGFTEHKTQVKIFPSPTDGELNIIVETEFMYSYQIYDIKGRALGSEKYSSLKTSIENVNSLLDGLYIIKIQLYNGRNFSYRFIKN